MKIENGRQFGLPNKPYLIYDMETFAKDWFFKFKDYNREFITVGNTTRGRGVKLMSIAPSYHLVGFNNTFYDDPMLTNIASEGLDVDQVKAMNDHIIHGTERVYKSMNVLSTDLYQYTRLGLKMIEAVNGMKIHEAEFEGVREAFEIDRPLTQEELKLAHDYCEYDVNVTELVFDECIPDMENKAELIKYVLTQRPELSPTRLWGKTTSSISRELFEGFTGRDDVIIPKTPLYNQDRDLTKVIPEFVYTFYEKGGAWFFEHQNEFDGATIVRKKNKATKSFSYTLKFMIGDMVMAVSAGGGHGDNKTDVRYEKAVQKDVGGLYPTTMDNYNLLNEMTDILRDLLESRFKNKKIASELWELYDLGNPEYSGEVDEFGVKLYTEDYNEHYEEWSVIDKQQNAQKLIVNSIYGLLGMSSDYNPLYCPYTRYSVCFIGQIALMDLAYRWLALKAYLLQLNTDSVTYSLDPNKYPVGFDVEELQREVDRVSDEWCADWGYKLDTDNFDYMIQQNVNNYLAQQDDGKLKHKGGVVSGQRALNKLHKGDLIFTPKSFACVSYVATNLVVDSGSKYNKDNEDQLRSDIVDRLRECYHMFGLSAFDTSVNVGRKYEYFTVDMDRDNKIYDLCGEYRRLHGVGRFVMMDRTKYHTSEVHTFQYVKDEDDNKIELPNGEFKSKLVTVKNTSDNLCSIMDEIKDYDVPFDDLDVEAYVALTLKLLVKNWRLYEMYKED